MGALMISIPVHNMQGQPIDQLEIDEQSLGGEVRPALLKQAYVRFHANIRQGSAVTRSRGRVAGSKRKMYRQKGTGNARRGPRGTNVMRGGGHSHAKHPKSWRQRMPKKMRRLANRNALLAKVVDGEVKLVDQLEFDSPSTRKFSDLLAALKIDRTCLVALSSTVGHQARSAANLQSVSLARVDHLNAFQLLNHRYLLAEKQVIEAWISSSQTGSAGDGSPREVE